MYWVKTLLKIKFSGMSLYGSGYMKLGAIKILTVLSV